VSKNTTTFSKSEVRKFVGLDVHKDTIAVAVAELGNPEVRSVGTIANTLDELRKTLRRLGSPATLRVCYEAGACGYVIYRFLQRLKIDCVVIAPSLVPKKPGDRVKTDRRDALALARLLRSGELTAVWVPNERHEALRDLVRAREDAVEDRHRARHRLSKMLLRLGIVAPPGRPWTLKHRRWLDSLNWANPTQQLVFTEYRHQLDSVDAAIARYDRAIAEAAPTSEHATLIAALQAMRGVKLLTAVTIVAEIGDLTRFPRARQLMSYAGVVPSEYSSGGKSRRGRITKSGNAHLRRVLIESAWHNRHRPALSPGLRARQRGLDPRVCNIAWNAQQRLHKRYQLLSARGKIKQEVVVAVGRELLGFVWAIGQVVHATQPLAQVA
jgi:transposase